RESQRCQSGKSRLFVPGAKLLVVQGRLLEIEVADNVMLNPELGSGLIHQGFNLGPGRCSLHPGRLTHVDLRDRVKRAFPWKMPQVSGQDQRPGLGQLQIHALVSRSVTRRRNQDYSAIVKDVVVFLSLDNDRLAVLKSDVF